MLCTLVMTTTVPALFDRSGWLLKQNMVKNTFIHEARPVHCQFQCVTLHIKLTSSQIRCPSRCVEMVLALNVTLCGIGIKLLTPTATRAGLKHKTVSVCSLIFLPCSFLRSLYNEPLTPSSNPSLSPGGSPLREGGLERSTLPSPADWSEFINASNSKVERDLAQLTLSDPEQRELYEAARLVQTAFRKYKVQAQGSGAPCCLYCSLHGLVLLDEFLFSLWRHVEELTLSWFQMMEPGFICSKFQGCNLVHIFCVEEYCSQSFLCLYLCLSLFASVHTHITT